MSFSMEERKKASLNLKLLRSKFWRRPWSTVRMGLFFLHHGRSPRLAVFSKVYCFKNPTLDLMAGQFGQENPPDFGVTGLFLDQFFEIRSLTLMS